MANKNSGNIVLGLDITKTIAQINYDLIPVLQSLNEVKIVPKLDTSALNSIKNELSGITLKVEAPAQSSSNYDSIINTIQQFTSSSSEVPGVITGVKSLLGSFGQAPVDVDALMPDFERFRARFNSTSESARVCAENLGITNREIINCAENSRNGSLTMNALSNHIQGMSLSAKAGQIAMKGLAMAGNMFISLAISAAISAIAKVLDNLIVTTEEAIEKSRALREEYSNAASAYASNISTLESLRNEYNTLSKGVNDLGENVSLSADEYERYNGIVSAIIDLSPSLKTGWDEEGNAISIKNGLLQQSIDLLEEEQKIKLKNMTTKAANKEVASGILGEIKTFEKNLDEEPLNNLSEASGDIGLALYNAVDAYKVEFLELEHLFPSVFSGYDSKSLKTDTRNFGVIFAETAANDYDAVAAALLNQPELFKNILSEEELKKFQRTANTYINELDRISSERDLFNQKYQEQLGLNIQSVDGYGSLPDGVKSFTNNYLNGVDYPSIKTPDEFDSIAISAIDLTKLLVDNTDLQASINSLLEDIPVTKYAERYREIVNNITNSMNLSGSEENIFRERLNASTYQLENKYNAAVQTTKDTLYAFDPTKFFTDHSINTTAEIDLWLKIISTCDSATEAKKRYLLATGANDVAANTMSKTLSDLNTISSGFTKLTALYSSFTNKKEQLDIGDLSNLTAQFGDLKGFDHFISIMGNASSSTKEVQTAFNQLTQEFIFQSGLLDTLNNENVLFIQSQLEQMGVANAAQFVNSVLAASHGSLAQAMEASINAGYNLLNITAANINALYQEGIISKDTANNLAYYALKKQLANSSTINTSDDVKNLLELAESAGVVSELLSGALQKNIDAGMPIETALQQIRLAVQDGLGIIEFKPPTALPAPPAPPVYKKPNIAPVEKPKKDFSEELDWAAESIENLTNKISLLDSQLANTTSYDGQKKKIKELTNAQASLLAAYEKTAVVYKSSYNKALKKLSKKDQEKVKSGAFDIELFKDKDIDSDKTGKNEKRYTNIKEALEAKRNYEKTTENAAASITKLKEYATQLADIPWDRAQVKIEKINTSLTLLDKQLDHAIGYKKKNKLLDEQLKLQKSIIKEQTSAIKLEKKESASHKKSILKDKDYKKLSKSNKKKVDTALKSGKQVDLNGLNLSPASSLYQDLITYNASVKEVTENQLSLNIATAEQKNLLSDIAKTKFDNISEQYQKEIDLIQAQGELLHKKFEVIERQGISAGTTYNARLLDMERSTMGSLKSELIDLEKRLDASLKNKSVVKYDDQWYEMVEEINNTKLAIDDCTLSILDLQAAMSQIHIDNLEKLTNRLSDMQKESDFLINLLSSKELIDKNGGYTESGLAVQGQHGQNYNNYMFQAEEYKNVLANLDSQNRNLKLGDLGYRDYLAQRSKLLEGQQSAILSAENEKKAILDLCKEGIDAKVNSMQELINKENDALDAEKELADYQAELSKKQQNAALIQKRLNALKNDDSLEKRKLKKELEKQLHEANQDLTSFEDNQNIKDQKEDKNKALEDYKAASEAYLKDTEKVFADSLSVINNNSLKISQTLKDTALNVGYSISGSITSAWSTAGTSVSNFQQSFTDMSAGVIQKLSEIKAAYLDAALAAEQAAFDSLKGFDKDNNILENGKPNTSAVSQTKLNQYVTSLGMDKLSWSQMAEMGRGLGIKDSTEENVKSSGALRNEILAAFKKQQIANILGKKSSKNVKDASKAGTSLNQYIMSQGYDKLEYGDMVRLALSLGMKGINYDSVKQGSVRNSILAELKKVPGFNTSGLVQGVIRSNGDDGVATLKKGDLVIDPDYSSDVLKMMNLAPILADMSKPLSRSASPLSLNITAPLISVENMDENMLYKIKNDRTIQNEIKRITVGQVMDGARDNLRI